MPRSYHTYHLQPIHHIIHAYSFTSCYYIIIQSNTCQTSKNKKNIKPGCTLAQLVAQAEKSRSSERDSHAGESSTIGTVAFSAVSLRRDPLRLSEAFSRSK